MITQTIFEILSALLAVIGSYIAYREFLRNKNLNAIDKFISYRDKLKEVESLSKIVKHIQLWQNNIEIRSQVPNEITLFDFYYFIGFYEEIFILSEKCHIDRKITRDMFAFYAIQIADNSHYWDYFNENYQNDNDWKNFRSFIEQMRHTNKKRCFGQFSVILNNCAIKKPIMAT
jgi:hypothetical protein